MDNNRAEAASGFPEQQWQEGRPQQCSIAGQYLLVEASIEVNVAIAIPAMLGVPCTAADVEGPGGHHIAVRPDQAQVAGGDRPVIGIL